jgi:signal transduction histidine kinase/ActR/RegA family two-component response regulator
MPNKPPSPAEAALRQRAETSLRTRHAEAPSDLTTADIQRLVHELQVQQIELKMQNEELQQATEKAESEREKFVDLYDFAPVGYLTLDHAGAIREANLTCASLLDIERSRLIGRRFGQFVMAADLPAFNDFLAKVFARLIRLSCEVALVKAGQPPIEVRLEAMRTDAGFECRVVVTDMTSRKQAEEDRLVLSKLESTGILAGGIAHDFNNLLTVILVNVELSQLLTPAGEKLAQHLTEAKNATLLARGLTQQLITFAKGGVEIRLPTALASVIHESARLALGGSNVRGDFMLAENLWPADVDAGQIGQVIRNIVQNAREMMPQGGVVTLQAGNVVLALQQEPTLPAGDYAHIRITDQGGGMSKEVLAKIFDPYFSTKQRGDQRGMGLGLTICHSIIQKHGGSIRAESEPGAGTTFHLWLPACHGMIPAELTATPQVLTMHGKILLMDDEEILRKSIGAALEMMGNEVTLAKEGRQAVEFYRQAQELGRPFDVVFLDLTVRQGMGGQEALEALLKLDPEVKTVVMSGYANDPMVLQYAAHGFKSAIAKPFAFGALQRVLATVLDSETSSPASS